MKRDFLGGRGAPSKLKLGSFCRHPSLRWPGAPGNNPAAATSWALGGPSRAPLVARDARMRTFRVQTRKKTRKTRAAGGRPFWPPLCVRGRAQGTPPPRYLMGGAPRDLAPPPNANAPSSRGGGAGNAFTPALANETRGGGPHPRSISTKPNSNQASGNRCKRESQPSSPSSERKNKGNAKWIKSRDAKVSPCFPLNKLR